MVKYEHKTQPVEHDHNATLRATASQDDQVA